MGRPKEFGRENMKRRAWGSYWRVLGEGVTVWRNLLEVRRLYGHKGMREREREQKLPVWSLGKKENRVMWEEGGSWGGELELREWDRERVAGNSGS